jgi:hypothetical protein
MRNTISKALATGGFICLLSVAFTSSAANGQEPALAPAPEPVGGIPSQTAPVQTQYVDAGYSYGCPTGDCNQGKSCKVRYRADYRRAYCRPEPFARNDCRDQYIYSAQGYGIPMTVPMAPVVCKQFNYGWGLPSSRMTHIPSGWGMYRPHAPRGKARVASRPMVYWPTDTMQQGAYYMKTPW